MTPSALLLTLVAAFLAAVGVLVRYFGHVELVAGYDPEAVHDETGLAKFVGANVLYVAALTVGVAVAEYATGDGTRWYWLAYVIAVAALAARMIRGSKHYESADG